MEYLKEYLDFLFVNKLLLKDKNVSIDKFNINNHYFIGWEEKAKEYFAVDIDFTYNDTYETGAINGLTTALLKYSDYNIFIRKYKIQRILKHGKN